MRHLLIILFILSGLIAQTQSISLSRNSNWQFRQAGTTHWYKAEVPGTVHTDLLANKLIPNPFYRDNESKVQWVETKAWDYQTTFNVSKTLLAKKVITIQFDGLDTYAEVVLNGRKIIAANNMFRQWTTDVKPLLLTTGNILHIHFFPSSSIAKQKKDSTEKALGITFPENERVFVRKAQYQFGWDWAPRLVTCGIWKDVRLIGTDKTEETKEKKPQSWNIKLITQKDSIGESFYFTVDGKPTFIKGTNWIPADNFLPRAKKLKRYEQLISAAKEAHINMFRVWGGGVYEDDIFYDLCDKYGIMVWQDFMFAGALYPADSSFFNNVREEIIYQVKRLRPHPCIALWCGNNEIDEAWHNWGWQEQFKYSPAESAKLWNDYQTLFHQLIPSLLKDLDPDRPYWASSPSTGWGRDSAYKKGDVHYWGVWWGKEPVEKYNDKVGRFNSEYGMQGVPDLKTIQQFTTPKDLDTTSSVMRAHQKHPFGYENIKHYIGQKFRTPKSFEDLAYVSQLMQADAIKTAIEAHRRNKPTTMGTMFWQWNDCWPVVSWSAIDYYGRKKALCYEVKRSFTDLTILPELVPFQLKFSVVSDKDSFNDIRPFFTLFSNDSTLVYVTPADTKLTVGPSTNASYEHTMLHDSKWLGVKISLYKDSIVGEKIVLFNKPSDIPLQKTTINYTFHGNTIELTSNKFAYGVFINVPDGVELEDNYFHLLPNEKKIIKFTSSIPLETIKKSIHIKSLVDSY